MRPRFSLLLGAFALVLSFQASSRGQENAPESSSLARYVPKDLVELYVEYQGLDSRADAWKKTAACKILNNTPAGAMLEEVAGQLLEKLAAKGRENPRQWADQVIAIVKHLAKSGFVFAVMSTPNNPRKDSAVVVIRDAFKDKNIRSIMAAFLQGANAPDTKPQAVVRAGHKVITGVDGKGKNFTWWVDDSRKEDIVFMFEKPEEADTILETLDGKRPSVLDHPRRAELLKSDDRFTPTGLAFHGPNAFATGKLWEDIGFRNVTAFEIRWGFQDEALMTLARIATSGPRKGVLALFEGSTFEKSKLPPIADHVGNFTIGSFDMEETVDRLVALARAYKPDAGDQVKNLAETLKAKSRLRLKEDILAHVGPKVAWYSLPSKGPSTAPGIAGLFGPAAEIPRFALVFDIDDAQAFGLSLDQAMAAANREFKSQGKPPGDAPAKGGRARASSGPAFEFRLMPGETKMYVLNVPPELAGQFPPSLRPAIRVGPKHAALGSTAEVARAALESKGAWTPSADLKAAFEGLPSKLKVLNISDPRDTLPALLASLPAKLQATLNTAILLRSPQPPPPGGAPAPGAPPSSVPNAGGSRRFAGAAPAGGGSAPGVPSVPGGPGGPGSAGNAPAPGALGAPGSLVLRVDADKLPKADAIKALLFPSLFTIETEGDEIRISSREAFVPLGDPSQAIIALSLALPAMQAMRAGQPAPGMAPPPGGAPGGGPGRSRPGAGGSPSSGGNNPSKPD